MRYVSWINHVLRDTLDLHYMSIPESRSFAFCVSETDGCIFKVNNERIK